VVLSDVADLWARSAEIDAVVVATPNDSHAPLALAALRQGLGVVVDKPMAASAAGAEEVRRTAGELGLFCSVFQNRRWDGDFLTVARLIADGELGGVHRFESRFDRWRPVVDASRWRERADPGLAGGLLFDLGSHLVDQAVVLFGPVSSVYAEVRARRAWAAVDDDVFVALQHRSGTTSHLWASVLAAQAGSRFRVLGDRAAYLVNGLDPQEGRLRDGADPAAGGLGRYEPADYGLLGADGATSAVPTLDGDYLAFYRGVADALERGAPPPVDPADSVQVLHLLEAARRSAVQGDVVAVG
jgi:predicted dehydrogenase